MPRLEHLGRHVNVEGILYKTVPLAEVTCEGCAIYNRDDNRCDKKILDALYDKLGFHCGVGIHFKKLETNFLHKYLENPDEQGNKSTEEA